VTTPTTSQNAHPSPHVCVALYTVRTEPESPTRLKELIGEHLAYLAQLHQTGELLLAGPFTDRLDGIAVFASSDETKVGELVLADPAVGPLFTVAVRAWTPVLGSERLPGPGDTGRAIIEQTIHRLFVEGVTARNAEAYFDRTYHPDVVIHEAPSLPYGGEYQGLPGAVEHALGFTRTWDRLQPPPQRDLSPRVIATDTEAVVIWTLRGRRRGDQDVAEFPAVSHYRFHAGRVIESRMSLFDTVAVAEFLAEAGDES
jgi:uncharacterized protein